MYNTCSSNHLQCLFPQARQTEETGQVNQHTTLRSSLLTYYLGIAMITKQTTFSYQVRLVFTTTQENLDNHQTQFVHCLLSHHLMSVRCDGCFKHVKVH